MSYAKLLSVKDEVEGYIEEDRRKLGIRISRRLISETPRDTGAAQINWIVSVDKADYGTVAVNSSSSGEAAVKAAQVVQSAGAYGNLFIQNNLPYIVSLNEGHSKQAPPKFVDKIVVQEVNRSAD